MRTTIKMIAERAGVSIGTVDRVLHDRPYVKAEVRERVLRVMEELDYHPNRMASALATSGTPRKLALVQPEWEEGFVRDEMMPVQPAFWRNTEITMCRWTSGTTRRGTRRNVCAC